MENNKYLEEFKIDLVKQFLNGRQKKEICEEYGVAKSTLWGWICKYSGLVEKSWEVEGIENIDEEYIDITLPIKKEYVENSMIKTTNETVRVFKNGYSIICHISKLSKVMKVISND
ncbi:MAG: transposase [Clostridia bacterium]